MSRKRKIIKEIKKITMEESIEWCKNLTVTGEEKKYISFSLYGNDKRYTKNAIINCEKAREYYSDWIIRIYYDNTVPEDIIDKLRIYEKVELVDMTNSVYKNKMFWRFSIVLDPGVNLYIIRDIDSHLSLREKLAVEEWLSSGKKFHVMRDHPSHCSYPMSGGMWGGKKDYTIYSLYNQHCSKFNISRYLEDMNFLNKYLWGYIKNDVLVHDSFQFRNHLTSCKPFPVRRIGFEHVGSVIIDGKERDCDIKILKKYLHKEINR